MKITVESALETLRRENHTFATLLRQGAMSVEIYQPVGKDLQQPHEQDEIYVIIAGNGIFQDGEETYPFQAGDLIFVPAHKEHRFLQFSPDFKTWVIFF